MACRRVLLAVVFGLVSQTAKAAIDQAINQTLWKLLYQVTEGQMADAVWLAQDSDADGISQ